MQWKRHKRAKAKTKTHKDKDITTNAWTCAAGLQQDREEKIGHPLEVLLKLCSISFPQEIYVSY